MTRYYLTFISFLICLIPIVLVPGQSDSLTLDFLNSLMALVCCVAIFSQEDKPYTLYKVFHIFMLFFFSIAPAVQYKYNTRMLGTTFSDDLYIFTEIWSLVAVLVFNACYYFSSHYESSNIQSSTSYNRLGTSREILFIAVSIAVLFVVFYLNGRNFMAMFVRSGELKEAVSQKVGQTENLIFSQFFRPMPMILFLFAWMCGVKHRITLYILFFLLLLSNMPTGVARNYAAGIWIPVLLTIVPFLRKRNVFVLLLTFGLLIVFPFLNSFRNFTGNIEWGINFNQFADMNFDAFSMFMRVIDYGDITYGRQLLGVLFFFIPRSIWPTKPVGSGWYIAHQTGLVFGNISMPIFGEGWLNFGAIGMIAFTLILAWFCARQDKSYWQIIVNQSDDIRSVRYFIIMGMLLFILRGDLMSSFAYTTGILISYLFCKRIMLWKNSFKEDNV